MSPTPPEIAATVLFALALLHTFSTSYFERLSRAHPRHAGVWHLLGEVEVVFGFWALMLVLVLVLMQGQAKAVEYVDTRNYTEPLFVFSIMVVAASRPVLATTSALAHGFARLLPVPRMVGRYFTALALIPLLGSFITEPAAMTLAALMLRDQFFSRGLPVRMRYATLGVLFVNVSIGGALTPFAAPPVLMVAGTWGWDLEFMMRTFGKHVLPVVLINAAVITVLFRRTLVGLKFEDTAGHSAVPALLAVFHLLLLAGIVVFAHHPPVFLGLMLLFLGVASAYPQYQDRLMLREALLVAFFLLGLVVLGGLQQWWLQPLLLRMNDTQIYLGATALTAITDNAALTYLAAQVPGLSDSFKYYVVAGAITGGGLTVIANAPNPAGLSILREFFPEGTVRAEGLFLAALPPTLVALTAFLFF